MRRPPRHLALALLTACGRSDAPPAPTPAPTAASTPVTPATPVAPATPPALPAPTTTPNPAAPGPAYIVWTSGAASPEGYESAWLAPGVADPPEALATRAQATAFAGGTLWGFEWPELSFTQISCEDFEAERPGTPGPTLRLPYLAARGLAGADAGKSTDITRRRSAYFSDDTDTRGPHTMVGEHWGRTIDLTGGAGDLLMVTDCEGGYGCGAHGEMGCAFVPHGLAAAPVKLDLAAATAALEPNTRAMVKAWRAGDEADDIGEPAILALSLRANDGEPLVDYLHVADVPYTGTDGEWGSYTQSRNHLGPPVPALGLPDVPAPVRAWLRGKGKDTRFGWSEVPADVADAVLAAFRDPTTVPPPRAPAPEPDAAPPGADAADRLKEGRALTRAKDYERAIAVFSAAIDVDAGLARAWSGRGYAKLLAGDLDGATADFTHALGLDPAPKFQAAVQFNLAETAEKRGDRAAALALYKTAHALAPSKAAQQRIAALAAP